MDQLRDQLGWAAAGRAVERRQFAATVVLFAIRGDRALVLHVGDGAVVARKAINGKRCQGLKIVESASTTFFVTDDPEAWLRIRRIGMAHDAKHSKLVRLQSGTARRARHNAASDTFDCDHRSDTPGVTVAPVEQASKRARSGFNARSAPSSNLSDVRLGHDS